MSSMCIFRSEINTSKVYKKIFVMNSTIHARETLDKTLDISNKILSASHIPINKTVICLALI